MLIGVTGNIGSGKTSVAVALGKVLEAPVLSADEICREQMQPGREGYNRFIRDEGTGYVDGNGCLDRQKLRRAVFQNKKLKGVLEAILHPLVREIVLAVKEKENDDSVIIAEIPLLFESGWAEDFDLIVSVYAPVDKSVTRVVGRDGGSENDVSAIIAAQMPQESKCGSADFVIDNSGPWKETEKQIVVLGRAVQKRIIEN